MTGRWKIVPGAFGIAGALAAGNVAAAESVYTGLDLDACTVLATDEESGGIALRCPGYRGAPVFVSEGDLRFDVDFGVPNDQWASFGPFNSIHDTVEWRVTDGRPVAAILRFFLDTGMTGGPDDKGQVLLVSKVGGENSPGCAIAAVDVNTVEQPNSVARGAAAMASRIDCGTGAPVAIGAEESFAYSLSGVRPEGQ